ncbi:MAG: DUF305 domain-containing protein [Arenimonas sp.]
MPTESKVVRSDRFTLSITGFVLIALVVALGTSAQAEANVSGMKHTQVVAQKQSHHTKLHAMFVTGDVDFDYAANMRMHQKLALEMSQAQLRNGKSPRLRALAARMITQQKNEIAILDRWMAAQTQVKSKTMLSAK